MSGSITRSVLQIKGDLRSIVSSNLIVRLCSAAGHTWRDRTLGPVETIYLFIAQILHGNTSCAHVRQLGKFALCSKMVRQKTLRLTLSTKKLSTRKPVNLYWSMIYLWVSMIING